MKECCSFFKKRRLVFSLEEKRAAGTGSCGSWQMKELSACRGEGSTAGQLLAAHALPLRWWC
jgi:hypothetical protein